MATITSSIIALLAAAPESPEPETISVPTVALASNRFADQQFHGTEFERQALSAAREPEPAPADVDDAKDDEDDSPANLGEDNRHPLDKYDSLTVVQMKNMAGLAVPTTRRYAYDQRPPVGLLGDTYVRRSRQTARGGGPVETDQSKWQFSLGGFLAAPFRLGYGQRLQPVDPANPTGIEARSYQSENSFHMPIVPDDQYLSYGYTQHNPKDWAEVYLSFGNGTVTGTTALQGNNFSDANFRDDTQLGISQAFLTLTPKLKARWARLFWRIGSFQARYGASGRYDAGELQTYLFGQTHALGEVGQLDILVKDFMITLEHGIGTHRPDANLNNDARFSLVHHAHLGFSYQNKLWLTFHWMNQFAREEPRLGIPPEADPMAVPGGSQRDGSMHVLGPELRIDWGKLGWWYLGFSYINYRNGESLSRGLEVIHSSGVGEFTLGLNENYFYGQASSGEIFSAIFQVEESIMKIKKGSAWYGQGRDFVWKVFGMVNKTKTDAVGTIPGLELDGVWKVKYGVDLEGIVTPWLTVAFRATQVRPNHRIDEQNFSILSPRLAFHTNFVTHETIEFQYSRYVYNTRQCDVNVDPITYRPYACVQPSLAAPEGSGADPLEMDPGNRAVPATPGFNDQANTVGQPDENVFMMMVNMWF